MYACNYFLYSKNPYTNECLSQPTDAKHLRSHFGDFFLAASGITKIPEPVATIHFAGVRSSVVMAVGIMTRFIKKKIGDCSCS